MNYSIWFYSRALMLLITGIITVVSVTAQQTRGYVTDIDGNRYKTVIIGQQEWMGENLKVTRLNDGTGILHETEMSTWTRVTDPAYCWYDNDIANKEVYGALYNWLAVNTGKLCPAGWRVPGDSDWEALTFFLGGNDSAGGKLKETGTAHWNPPNTGATNETGFSAVPGGYRYGQYWGSGTYYEKGLNSYFWSGSECTPTHAWSRTAHAGNAKLYRSFFTKNKGFSVRCIKDN
jgi:uncharacterized protein (TIGR02145 family)